VISKYSSNEVGGEVPSGETHVRYHMTLGTKQSHSQEDNIYPFDERTVFVILRVY
jgi:hypothetical protein